MKPEKGGWGWGFIGVEGKSGIIFDLFFGVETQFVYSNGKAVFNR